MTLKITITNNEGNAGHKANVNVWEERRGEEERIIPECRELSPGESCIITLYGRRGVTVVEQVSGE